MAAGQCNSIFLIQITQFNPLKTDNTDDVLDLLAYMNKVIEQYGAYVLTAAIIQMQESSAIPVLEEGMNSPF